MEEINPLLFTTATILEWKYLLKPNKYKDVVIESLRFCVKDNRVKIFGFVIMPNHIHLLWTINIKHQLQHVQRDIFKFTAQQIKFDLVANHPKVLEKFYVGAKDRKYQFWERNPLSIECYSRDVAWQKLNYIHNNPCAEKWNLAPIQENYKYSSAGFYLTGKDDWGFLNSFMEYFE